MSKSQYRRLAAQTSEKEALEKALVEIDGLRSELAALHSQLSAFGRERAADAFEEAANRLNDSRGEHPGKVVAEFLARAAALRGKEPCCEIDASRWPYGHSCPPAAPKPKGEDS